MECLPRKLREEAEPGAPPLDVTRPKTRFAGSAVAAREDSLAPRPSSLAGKVGVLFNVSKPRGIDFFDRVEELSREDYGVKEVIRASKRTFTKLAPAQLLEDLARGADFVVLAIADCGSCNICTEYQSAAAEGEPKRHFRTCGLSACVHEALFFERRGIPTAVVATTEYELAARVQQSELRLPPYPLVVVRRSIQRLSREQVRRIADDAMGAIVNRLTGTGQVTSAQ